MGPFLTVFASENSVAQKNLLMITFQKLLPLSLCMAKKHQKAAAAREISLWIEYFWGMVKKYLCDGSFNGLKENLPKALNSVPIYQTVRRWEHRLFRWVDAYWAGLGSVEAHYRWQNSALGSTNHIDASRRTYLCFWTGVCMMQCLGLQSRQSCSQKTKIPPSISIGITIPLRDLFLP